MNPQIVDFVLIGKCKDVRGVGMDYLYARMVNMGFIKSVRRQFIHSHR